MPFTCAFRSTVPTLKNTCATRRGETASTRGSFFSASMMACALRNLGSSFFGFTLRTKLCVMLSVVRSIGCVGDAFSSLYSRMCGVRFRIRPSSRSFNPFMKPSRVTNMVMLNITPTAATMLWRSLARSRVREMLKSSRMDALRVCRAWW